MCLGNLHTQTGISTLIHTTTLDTKLAQLEPLYTERKHYQVHILGYPDRDLTSKTLIPWSPEDLVGQFVKRSTENDKPSGYVTLP
jgi:hypothetical protein